MGCACCNRIQDREDDKISALPLKYLLSLGFEVKFSWDSKRLRLVIPSANTKMGKFAFVNGLVVIAIILDNARIVQYAGGENGSVSLALNAALAWVCSVLGG